MKRLLLGALIVMLLVAGCARSSIQTSTPTQELPKVTSAFAIEGRSFRFLGSFGVGPWFLKDIPWQQDLITTAKESGISVLHEMVPPFEKELGVYDGEDLRQLDLLLDQASRNGVYVTIEVMQGWQITTDPQNPYYHPGGIEGLIKDKRLKDAYKKRLEYLMMHQNTLNGKIYRDDPTILAWVLIMEPILAPFNYPVRLPNITFSELRDWFQEMALHAKSLDPNHLVAIGTTGAIVPPLPPSNSPQALNSDDWLVAFDVPALDFLYVEDAEARILHLHPGYGPDRYPLKLFALGKPVVMNLSFTSGLWDLERIGGDYVWQASTLREEAERYFEVGASGVVISGWGSALARDMYKTYLSESDLLFLYDIDNEPIVSALKEIAAEFDTLNPTAEP